MSALSTGPSPLPFGLSVKGLILDDRGRCLVLRRLAGDRHGPGLWDLPGGKCDPGEPFDRALIREAREETGYDVALIGAAQLGQADIHGSRVVFLFLEATIVGGEERLGDEHDRLEWQPVQDLDKLSWTPELREPIRRYARERTR